MHDMSPKMLEQLMPYENIVWDWNGTLLNDLSIILKAEAAHFPLYGIAAPTLEQRYQLFGFPVQGYYERLGFSFEDKTFEQINDHFLDIYSQYLPEARLFEGVLELLESIRALGKRQFVLSAAPQDHLVGELRAHNIMDHFSGIYGLPHTQADSKISRGLDLIREHNPNLSSTLMIGDTLHDLEVAKALGFESLLVADGHHCPEALSLAHHRVLKTRY